MCCYLFPPQLSYHQGCCQQHRQQLSSF
jgi:hypothetical protein